MSALPRSKVCLVALAATVLFVGMLAAREIDRPGGLIVADTTDLLHGVAALDRCLSAGDLRCTAGVDHWPPLQYAPALAMKRIGMSFTDTGIGLIYLNGLAVIGVLVLLWIVGRRTGVPGLGPLALLAGLVSPLLWYANVSFSEGIAAFLVALMVTAIGLGWSPWLVAAAVCLASLSKETAAPFLLAAGAIAILTRPAGRRRAPALALGIGLALGVVMIAAFNLSRFGVPWNEYYVDPDWATKGALWRLDFLAAEVVSPNAGVVWFWPIGAAVLAFAAVSAGAAARRERSLRGRPGLAIGAVSLFAVLLTTFAGWWSPFGWYAWGARFVVPWVPAVLCLLMLTWGEEIGAAARRLLGGRVAFVTVVILAAGLGLAQLGAALKPTAVLATFYEPTCPYRPPDLLQRAQAGDPAIHRAQNICTSRTAWLSGPMLTHAAGRTGGPLLPFALVYVVAVTALAGAVVATERPARPSPYP